MRNLINESIKRFYDNTYNSFGNLWKTEFNIFKSDLNQYLIEGGYEPISGFISFETLGSIILNIKNMFGYGVGISTSTADYLKDFRYPFLLNIRLPFKSSYDYPTIFAEEGFDFANKDGTRQLYFSLLDRKYSNKWYIPTENRNINKKRSDIKYVPGKNNLSGRFLNYTNYYILGLNSNKNLCYVPVNDRTNNISNINLIKYTEIILVKFNDFYFNFSITPFGAIIWDHYNKSCNGNITKIIKCYEY